MDNFRALNIKTSIFLTSIVFGILLTMTSCISDDDDDDEPTETFFMCTETRGIELLSYCASSDIVACGASEIKNGTYNTLSACQSDESLVIDSWVSGNGLIFGPNSNENSGGSGSSNAGGASCELSSVWSGSLNDTQVSSLCQAACIYYDAGGQSQGDQVCGQMTTGYPGSASDCSVCN